MHCVHTFELGKSAPRTEEAFRAFLRETSGGNNRLLALFAEEYSSGRFLLHAVAGGSVPGRFVHACVETSPRSFRTFTDVCPGAHLFEREIYDLFGLVPEGHPELNPLRFHEGWPKRSFPLRSVGAPAPDARRGYRFLQVRGEGIHEVAVGPVHAGVIEPGHFRFSCAGETIQNLEIRLGYQHKGIESLFPGSPGMGRILLSESISGDTAVGHSTACARLLEAITGNPADPSAERWRAVALEIERISNHCGDLGGLSTDIGYLFGAAHFGRLRGAALNLLLKITGNRFGRGLNRIGGIGPRVPGIAQEELIAALGSLRAEVESVGATMLDAPSVVARMEGTGRLLSRTAATLQFVGMAARASGRDVDARRDFPSPAYVEAPPAKVLLDAGDVMARAGVRVMEMRASFDWLPGVLTGAIPPGTIATEGNAPAAGRRLIVSVEEGWRGEIVHAAIVDDESRITRFKVVDPSFRNWPGLLFAVQKNVISDFPVCNKSFNLSYSGADL
ncbi:NADH-quinone oxidoreductase subunit C [Candidatus Deferrimicrobium sp.]|uniref:hydrogenase large subunit n=1 Tax=Candidatus Deferrimicrobium sp. TaxID=3060586 RepID=UPI002ED07E9F